MLPYKLLIIYFTMILFIVTAVTSPQSARAQKSARLVEAVEIEGNSRLSADDILTHIQTRPGIEYSQKQVQLDLKALLDWGVFDTTQTKVTITEGLRGGVVVIFDVKELLVISEVKFKGLRDVKEAELLQTLNQNKINLARGEVYDPLKVSAAVGIIKSLFAEHGRPNISVTMRSEVGDTYISLEFLIEDEK
jgi:outer membrane protein assembly factor BamA